MTWSDISCNPRSKALRQFAGGWLIVFLALGANRYLKHGQHQAGLVLGATGVVIGGLGLLKPSAVRWLFVVCMVLAFPIGWLVSNLMLALMFYGIITPIGLLFRMKGRDLLCRKPAAGRPSFWSPKQTPRDIRSYFRQY
jgi:saxitoxin biosynthesis operon SxtJ-like protein